MKMLHCVIGNDNNIREHKKRKGTKYKKTVRVKSLIQGKLKIRQQFVFYQVYRKEDDENIKRDIEKKDEGNVTVCYTM